jgi:sugar/nucleoside kinase (ribokinase family)
MTPKKIIISGTGCALADFLYNNVSFNSLSFKRYQSKRPGDGGLNPGKLVFTEELERYSGLPYSSILEELTGNRKPDAFNVGGPALVSLIHASQMLESDEYEVRFFGMAGKDDISGRIFEIVEKTPLDKSNYLITGSKATPFTDVLSDPGFADGHGERTFVNNIGAAWEYLPESLKDDFFRSDIVCFGGTALVPLLHEKLTTLLEKAKNRNCITLVNTVFDFINEKKDPGEAWPLGNSMKSFPLIDILIMDHDEALRISGQQNIGNAASYFINANVSSFIITNGANDLYFMSNGRFFKKLELTRLPVSKKVIDDIISKPQLKGDTTGCGDNFAGGVLSSVAWQLKSKSIGQFDLIEAISWGVASGGFTCFTIGGTYLEKFHGEKRIKVSELQMDYIKQIGYK